MAAPITRDQAARIAELARLRFSDGELDRLAAEMSAVLDHAADVEALDLAGVEPAARPLPLKNVTRGDEVRPSLDRDEVLAQAPSALEGCFRVPPILGEPA